jgi:Ala-tRNA(Pro) deacylase
MNVRDYLRGHRVPFEVLLHRPAPSAAKLASTVHVPGRCVAKSVLLRVGSEYVLAVLPATHKIDFDRLRHALGVAYVELAQAEELERVFFDCQPGALPPLGKGYGVKTVVDASLVGVPEILFKGNVRHEGVWMRFSDYEAIEAPEKAQFAEAIAPRRKKPVETRARKKVG